MSLPLLTCPSCGTRLTVHVGDAQSCPWLCPVCCQGFWTAQLSTAGRACWRPQFRDHGYGNQAVDVHTAVDQETRGAAGRSTGVTVDMLPLLNQQQLGWLARRLAGRPAPEAVALLQAVNTLTGGGGS